MNCTDYGSGPSSATLMDPTGLFASAPPFPPDLFPFAGLVPSWDSAPASSWLPDRAQPSGIRDEIDESSALNTDPLMRKYTPLIQLSGSLDWFNPPSVSVEIGPWIDATSWTTVDPSVDSDVNPVDEALDIDAHLGWDFKPSTIKWLDSDVSSEVAEFPLGIKLSESWKIYAFHRVTGCPSQFLFFDRQTAFLINLTDMADMDPDPEVTVDQLIRDQDTHSWGKSTGSRSKVDVYLPGSFFGLRAEDRIACRHARPGRELDPEEIRSLAAATIRTREMQDNTEVGRTLAFYHSLQGVRCKGIRPDRTKCDGLLSLRKLNSPIRNKTHILLCSKRGEALAPPTLHLQVQILDLVSKELFVKVMNGERIIDEEDTGGTCSRVVSGRTGSKGRHICPFNHHKNGLPYFAKIEHLTCTAKMHIYCPLESHHPALARMAIVVPDPKSGHSHPPPPNNKCTHAVAARYWECVRKFGPGATVTKVENAQSTKDLLGGNTPTLFHPALISRDTKTRIIQEAAPLLGFADALVPTVDLEHVRSAVAADPQELLSGIPKLLDQTSETRQRIFNLKYIKTREELEEFSAWLKTLPDPHGVLKRWWGHKTMHRWLLRGVVQCLSNIPLEQWNTMEATTNLGEAQHAWNNAQTGISMGVIESFKK
ncbi:hypothetical protein B0H16DRAFT_1773850 [Mycena metata]|uniref:Uncharacterized protein n=1 Tax=Mycena metata TaxID=1033252 RepID=A0AAD7HX38_9AGAR|nr:hypothetical protein B0H16DRAFT_1773850 [Mycena metata]